MCILGILFAPVFVYHLVIDSRAENFTLFDFSAKAEIGRPDPTPPHLTGLFTSFTSLVACFPCSTPPHQFICFLGHYSASLGEGPQQALFVNNSPEKGHHGQKTAATGEECMLTEDAHRVVVRRDAHRHSGRLLMTAHCRTIFLEAYEVSASVQPHSHRLACNPENACAESPLHGFDGTTDERFPTGREHRRTRDTVQPHPAERADRCTLIDARSQLEPHGRRPHKRGPW